MDQERLSKSIKPGNITDTLLDNMDLLQRVHQHFTQSLEVKKQTLQIAGPAITRAAERIAHCLSYEGKILACGNGGSASDAQHFASEMVNRFALERPGLPAIALTTDTALLTSIANDYAFEEVFARQIKTLGQGGDILMAISTSGNSSNIVAAVRAAQESGMLVIALSGRDGGHMAKQLTERDIEIRISSTCTARIQEVHILAIHCICDLVDHLLFGEGLM
jgi:D-sedoheptulose 7-phosphate isomerase